MKTRRIAILAAIAAACAAYACSANLPSLPPALSLSGKPNLTSFLGVRFGDTLYRVQNRYQSGIMETGQYGSDIYRIDKIEVDSIHYEQVRYEFTSNTGMQMVAAWFTPESSDKVLEKLVEAVGPPGQQNSSKGTSASDTEASWQLPHGERVIFSGPRRLVAVLGPGGNSLKQDFLAVAQKDTQ